MYLPAAFRSNDASLLETLLARDPLATLVTLAADGTPAATPVPVLLEREADQLTVLGHLARANPQVGHSGEVLLILQGPSSYVSPSWYLDKVPAARVPTWNYVTAHLRGTLEWLSDPADTAEIVAALSAREEPAVGSQWRYEPDNPAMVRQLSGIVGFRLRVLCHELKLKLSQNHPPANVQGVIAGLQARGRPADVELAQWMNDHAPNSDA